MEYLETKKQLSDKLIFFGLILFFIGLIIGLMIPLFANSRMGVSSHVEGVFKGVFLIILGLIWHKVDLSNKCLKITFWSAVYGTFVNCFGILIAAIFNGGKMLGFVTNGQEGTPIIKGMVSFSLISLSNSHVANMRYCFNWFTSKYKSK